MSTTSSYVWHIASALVADSTLSVKHKALCEGWIRSRSHKLLASCASALFPNDEYHREAFIWCRRIEALFRKNADFANDAECEKAAWTSFHEAEKQCRITNRRLQWYFSHLDRLDPDMRMHLERMEQSIQYVLGDVQIYLEQLPELFRLTSGATEDRSRTLCRPHRKVRTRYRCTGGSIPFVRSLGRYYGLEDVRTTRCDFNRITMVPKNWKTHRTIACEPEGSLPLQLTFDTYVKRRLRRKTSVDLSSQEPNQEKARIGSLTGEYATLDLKAASDTVSLELVAWMFPPDWFEVLSSYRSLGWKYSKGGEDHRGIYSKFSSMGNGATFALETLLFWAAARAVGSKECAIYGDDIVIETHLAEPITRLLKFLGFQLNAEKSFVEGPFRESCGADWYEGCLVTPFYLRKTPQHPWQWHHLINGIAAYGYPGSKIYDLLRGWIGGFLKGKINFVPFCDSSEAGVWLDPHTCYTKKLVRTRSKKFGPFVPVFQGFSSSTKTVLRDGRRNLFLWFLQKGLHPSECQVTSRVAWGEVSYRRMPIRYQPPSLTLPTHLWLFSDWIVENDLLSRPAEAGNRHRWSPLGKRKEHS